MDDRLAELLGDLRARFETGAPRAEVEAYLAERGYDPRQIGEILSLLAADRAVATTGVTAEPTPRGAGARGAFRVQGPHERGRFSPEAWGHLLRLQAALGMSAAELEPLIERALTQLEGRIGLDELRALLEALGFDDGASAGHVTVH
jgi:Smg protein